MAACNNERSAPVVTRFAIKGLHGYKDVEFNFSHPVKIVIAENGAGKTTILSALEAFLRADFNKVATHQFDTIECEVAGVNETLVLHRDQISKTDEQANTTLVELANDGGVDIEDLRQAIALHVERGTPLSIESHPIFERIYNASPFDSEEIVDRLMSVKVAWEKSFPEEVRVLASTLRGALGDYDILYLPTFRRIERPLAGRRSRRRSGYAQRLVSIGDQPAPRSDINYGLSDVEDRLASLTESIQRRSNHGYRQISTAIIDDLIAGKFGASQAEDAALPPIDDLRLFFSRLQQSPRDSEHRLSAITRLYDAPESTADASPLRYFLAMLSTVVNQTKELEADIEQFVEKANLYLRGASDEKLLVYDASRMKVMVKNTWTGMEVKLNDLSSGEKQVISLFAHMHLYDRKKIVLIDEPELSLSMEWQKRLLPDVAKSPRCSQLLAITHSPFIFDNELDPYAGPLNIERRRLVGAVAQSGG